MFKKKIFSAVDVHCAYYPVIISKKFFYILRAINVLALYFFTYVFIDNDGRVIIFFTIIFIVILI